MLLPETANAIGLRFTDVGLALSCLLFDPIELLEDPDLPNILSIFPPTRFILGRHMDAVWSED
ncbi:hypothetical protein ASC90_27060 [Rhizobium sp. Root1220]|nr:hypothetical protein ASC90_27060 [Rhizobium sp. Root1220]